jgi:transcriptional regulator with XRE-family HTH domain
MTTGHRKSSPLPSTQPSILTVAERLRERIKEAGLSQRAAARELGVDERTMRYWCAGEYTPPPMALRALDRRVRHHESLHQAIRSNQQQIDLLDSGRMALGCRSDLSTPSAAAAEAHRLRRVNEELQALLRLEEAFQRRQAAFLRLHGQFLPRSRGALTDQCISEFEAAEDEWRTVQQDVDRIVKEIRAGRR